MWKITSTCFSSRVSSIASPELPVRDIDTAGPRILTDISSIADPHVIIKGKKYFRYNIYHDRFDMQFGKIITQYESQMGRRVLGERIEGIRFSVKRLVEEEGQMEDGRVVRLLQYVVSLAVTEAIQSACQTKGYPLLDFKLKWPKDIYFQGLTVGGVLCTSTYRSKMFNVAVGIGLNLDNDQPTTCLNQELKRLNSEAAIGREELMALFFKKLESLFEVFMANGFQALEALYILQDMAT